METTEVASKIKWRVDTAHSEIDFRVRHLVIANVRGKIREFDSSIYTTGDDFLSVEIDFWGNPASIDTGDEKRDAHLKSPDFFDVEKFKEINFTGNTYEKGEQPGHFMLYGDLTMKGIAKQIKLDVEFGGIVKDPWGNDKAVFAISGKINRKDWGLDWNSTLEAGGLLVSEEVWINCEVQLAKELE